MQAPDRAVAVEAGRQAVGVQDLPETSRVRGQLGRFHGRVLDKGQRPAGTGARRHEQAEARLADLQQRGLLGRVHRPERVVAVAVGPPGFVQAVEPGHRLGHGVAEERHEQQGLGVAVQDRSERGVFDLPAGQLDDGAVEQFNGGGLAGQRVLGGLDGRLHGGEVAHGDRPGTCGAGTSWTVAAVHDGDQSALGAHHELGQIEPGRPRQPVQPVTARLPPEPREAGGDGLAGGVRPGAGSSAADRSRRVSTRPRGSTSSLRLSAGPNVAWLASDSTTSRASTWSIVMPYRTDWLPAELLPIIPPSVARFLVEVSGPNSRPCRAPARFSCSCTTPG